MNFIGTFAQRKRRWLIATFAAATFGQLAEADYLIACAATDFYNHGEVFPYQPQQDWSG